MDDQINYMSMTNSQKLTINKYNMVLNLKYNVSYLQFTHEFINAKAKKREIFWFQFRCSKF